MIWSADLNREIKSRCPPRRDRQRRVARAEEPAGALDGDHIREGFSVQHGDNCAVRIRRSVRDIVADFDF